MRKYFLKGVWQSLPRSVIARNGILIRGLFLGLFLSLSLIGLSEKVLSSDEAGILSPNGEIEIRFAIKEKEKPYPKGERFYYSVFYKGKELLLDSPLSLKFKNMPPFDQGLKLTDVSKSEINESYTPVYGKFKNIVSHCNEARISLQEADKNNRKIHVIFRAYNDGIAFRYYFPEQAAFKDFQLTEELSCFYFVDNHTVYAGQTEEYASSQENVFEKTKLNSIYSMICPPLLVEIKDGPWAAITEANLTDYAGMYLTRVKKFKYALVTSLSPLPDDPEILVKASTPHFSPWRVLMIGEKIGDLIESNIVMNLNEPCAIEDTSWIKPGKSAWDWWSGWYIPDADFPTGSNMPTLKHFIQFAGDMGFEYMMIDEGWSEQEDITKPVPGIDIPGLVEFADKLGVKIILWARWTNVDRQMDKTFPLYEKWGIAGVKIDFMSRNDQEMVNFYDRTVKNAAKHHLLIDFHGAYLPTGSRRTYPNLITREGVLGNEYNKFDERITPDHCLTLPFTRMLAGPMDFTPGGFLNVTDGKFIVQYKSPFVRGTRCFQLAMFVVYESPLQVCCDDPGNYRNQKGLEFLRKVPATWDDTKVINAQVGDYITIARKHGNDWFIGSMTDWTPRTLEIPLTFLSKGEYVAQIFSDGKEAVKDPTQVEITEISVTSSDVIKADLAPGGGQVIHIYPRTVPAK